MQLQAFIFCGGGHNLVPFSSSTLGAFSDSDEITNNGVDDGMTSRKSDKDVVDSVMDDGMDSVITNTGHLPKALLPIANRRMIEYVIDWCDQADFKEIFVVAHADEIKIIQNGLKEFLELRNEQFNLIEKGLSTNIHTHHIQHAKKIKFISTKSKTMGETLISELLPSIKMDFVLLPCDFITDIPPQIFIDQFQNRDSDNLAMSVFYKNSIETTLDKKKLKQKQFFTVYSDNMDGSDKQPVLLDIYSKENVSKTKYLQIRSHLLWKYPNTTVSTNLLNASIYFCSYELCQFFQKPRLVDEKNVNDEDSIKNKSKKNISNNNMNTNSSISNPTTDRDPLSIYPSYFTHNKNLLIPDHINTKTSLSKLFRDLARRSWRHVQEKRETIGIFILPEPNVACFIRANNLATYMDANRFILRIKSNTPTLMASSSAIGADALVDPSTVIGEKSSVKLSTIKTNCQIGSKCRISGSIILNDAIIDDDCILENVIVGPNAHINTKSKLTNCYVEGNFIVEAKSIHKGETLMNEVSDDEFDEDGYVIYSGDDNEGIDHLSSDAIGSSDDDGDSSSGDDYNYAYSEDEEDDGLFAR